MRGRSARECAASAVGKLSLIGGGKSCFLTGGLYTFGGISGFLAIFVPSSAWPPVGSWKLDGFRSIAREKVEGSGREILY